jgi:DNA polymerase/3'-5' exonuclease PolX
MADSNNRAENIEDEKKRRKGYKYPKNIEIAEKLKELGKLHHQMPLDKLDPWRCYSLNKAAGRIQNLDFEVTLEAKTLKMVSRIQGVGESMLGKIKEVLTYGTIERMEAWKHDPERQVGTVQYSTGNA